MLTKDVEKHYGKDVISNDKKNGRVRIYKLEKMGFELSNSFQIHVRGRRLMMLMKDSEDLMLENC